jgi:hypothetical protein
MRLPEALALLAGAFLAGILLAALMLWPSIYYEFYGLKP